MSTSSIAHPLTSLLRGKPRKLCWTEQAQAAFSQLKQSLTTAPILSHPDPNIPFIVEVDASNYGIGAILSQRQGNPGKAHPCALFSLKLTPAEANYDVANQELLSIKKALEEWRHWLEVASVRVHHAARPSDTVGAQGSQLWTPGHSAHHNTGQQSVLVAYGEDVENYVGACGTCAQSRTSRQLHLGLLELLPIPKCPWSHMAVDFITDLISGYHSQYNGQTERLNQEIGRYLCSYSIREQQRWSEFLHAKTRGTPPGVLCCGRPLVRGAGLLWWSRWKSSMSDGSRISLASTQERSSAPYPFQSTRFKALRAARGAELYSSRGTYTPVDGQDVPGHISNPCIARIDTSVQVPSTAEKACQTDITNTVTHSTWAVQTRYKRNDEEAVLDRGGTRSMLNTNFEKEELEGHRTLYIGVHVPLGRRSHRRHRHHGHRHRKRSRERDSGAEDGRESPSYTDTPSQRVQFLLGMEDEDEEHIPHALFTELDEICLREGEDAEWKETARWLKFEEDVEDGGERWSKPYVATLSLHSLFELRSCILNGIVMLDMRANSLEEIADMVLDQHETSVIIGDEVRRKIRNALLKQHHHQNQKKLANRIPIVRSFADIGKKQSEPHSMDKNGQMVSPQSQPCCTEGRGDGSRENSAVDFSKIDLHFMKKIPPGAEASNILVGELEFLEKPVVAFVRLSPAVLLNGLAEVPITTRFLFILLGPMGKGPQYHEIGRSIATLMTDEGLEGVWVGDHMISSLLFADDVVLLAPSSLDLLHALGRFAAECEAAGMRVSTSKSEAMVLDRKKVACTLQVGGEFLPQVEEFKYLEGLVYE
ncbi:hypothetical protein QTP86_005997 [Hemibagrus guttatus]|nr:hypothetical protein QTP86_005997 [Hemibagrus guttatus]